ncbi:helix-turn-helix transcriptional regulator, partial [Nocardioides massiliensis]
LGDSAVPYLAISEVLGRLSAARPVEVEALVADHPALARLAARPSDGPALDRAELVHAVHALLEALGATQPLLLVLEDAHWADASTRELVGVLLSRGFSTAVSVVVSYRSDDLHRRHPLRPHAAAWARTPGVRRLTVEPMADAEVRELVRSLHPEPLPHAAVETIVRRAEGNAFFVEELVGAARSAATATDGLPEDLADLLLVRLESLGETARRVVRVAAVAGQEVSHELLAATTALAAADLEDALREIVERHVLVPTEHGYAFRHALLGEAVYDDLLPGERVRLHTTYAEVLQAGTVSGSAAQLALHARAAQDPVTAVRASVRAGRDALAVGGPEEAARHFETALELAADPRVQAELDDLDRSDIGGAAAKALVSAGQVGRGRQLLEDELARGAELSDVELADLLATLSYVHGMADAGDPLAPIEEALGLLERAGSTDEVRRARYLARYAKALLVHDRETEAGAAAAEALELAAAHDLHSLVADVRVTLARIDTGDDSSDAIERLEAAVEHAQRSGGLNAGLRARYVLGFFHYRRHDLESARAVWREVMTIADRRGQPWTPYAFEARLMSALSAYQQGAWDDADALLDTTTRRPPEELVGTLRAQRLAVVAARGGPDGIATVRELQAGWEADGLRVLTVAAAGIDLYGDAGDLAAAIDLHERAVSTVARLWHPLFQAQVRLGALLVGQLATAVERGGTTAEQRAQLVARAEGLVARAEEIVRGRAAADDPLGAEGQAWVMRLHAEVDRLRWRADLDPPPAEELVERWRACVAGFEAHPHVFERARSQARLAAVLQATGVTDEAAGVLASARQAAVRLGAAVLLAELDRLGARPPAETGRPTVLTPREREILALVAQGHSNGQIGRQLFISTKTVSVHVSNVLAKLGAASRTEAAAIARRRGLL